MADLGALAFFAGLLGAAVGVGEALRAAGAPPEATRRVVHLLVGLTVAASLPWFATPGPIYALAAVFAAGNALALARGWFPGMHGASRRSLGTVVFPVALVAALALTWSVSADRVFVARVAFVVLALADPAASLAGQRARRARFAVGQGTKSASGSLAFFAVALAALGGALAAWAPSAWSPATVALAALSVAALATAAEAVGRDGWDNLLVVFAVIVGLTVVSRAPDDLARLGVSLAAAVTFGGVVWRVRALDVSGALAGGLLAWALVAVGGVAWAVPALSFFVLGSALSRLPGGAPAPAEMAAHGGRTSGQVLANGGWGLLALVAYAARPDAASLAWLVLPWAAFTGGFAVAAADTFATEIGTRYGGTPRRLGLGAPVAPGTSGGVTAAGTLAAAVGALAVGGAGALAAGLPLRVGLGLAGAGLLGAAVDTWLGAAWQARHRTPDGRVVEDAPAGGTLVSGLAWLDNSAVNAVATGVGALAALLGAALVLR